MPRIIVTEACEPALPPVSISIGMEAVRIMPKTGIFSVSSFAEIIIPVNVAEIISSISHGRRWATRLQTLVFM